jgi:hypothetical protein
LTSFSGRKSEGSSICGVAVSSIEESLRFWRDGLGAVPNRERSRSSLIQGVRVAILPVGASRIELLEASSLDVAPGETPIRAVFLSTTRSGDPPSLH